MKAAAQSTTMGEAWVAAQTARDACSACVVHLHTRSDVIMPGPRERRGRVERPLRRALQGACMCASTVRGATADRAPLECKGVA